MTACQKHEYSNLIALCPICHRRAHLAFTSITGN
ncbi:HNH endonuclease [Pseudomonas sp. p21]